MSNPDPEQEDKGPDHLDRARAIDAICDRFEAALQNGEQPDIRAELDQADAGLRADLFRELLGVQLSLLVKPGERPGLAMLLAEFPEYTEEILDAFSLADGGVSTVASHPPDGADAAEAIEEMLRELKPEDRYRIEGEVARGGMGAIHLAEDPALRRRVAVKTMLRTEAAPDELARFIEEAQITGQLDHPGIVPVHELGVDEAGAPFYSMKYVRGRDLQAILKGLKRREPELQEEFPLHRLLGVFDRVCDAVAFAHAHGVIHRDLKPGNIRVGEFGEVLVMDWGLARILSRPEKPETPTQVESIRGEDESGAFHTLAGSVMGSPQYMAPEQASGDSGSADERADIYSLGAVLYHVITLRPLFPSGQVPKVLKQLRDGFEIEFPDGVPGELEGICRKALNRRPEDRYQSVGELQQALRDFSLHRESLVISGRASALARAAATEGESVDLETRYGHFAEAVGRFDQALELWSGNAMAREGLRSTTRKYAELALEHGDFNLAEAQLKRLGDDPEMEKLRDAIASAKQAALRRRRAVIWLRRGLAAAALLIVSIVSVAFFLIRREQEQTAANLRDSLRSQIVSNYASRNYEGTIAAARGLVAAGGEVRNDLSLRDPIRRAAWLSPWRGEWETGLEEPLRILAGSDGKRMYLAGGDAVVQWDPENGRPVHRVALPGKLVSPEAIFLDSNEGIWVAVDGEIHRLKPGGDAFESAGRLPPVTGNQALALAVAADRNLAVVATGSGDLIRIDLEMGKVDNRLEGSEAESETVPDAPGIPLLRLSPEGDLAAVIFPGQADEIRVFSTLPALEHRQTWRNDSGQTFREVAFDSEGRILGVTADGKRLAVDAVQQNPAGPALISRHGAVDLPLGDLVSVTIAPESGALAGIDGQGRLLVDSLDQKSGFRVVQQLNARDRVDCSLDGDRNVYTLDEEGTLRKFDGVAFGLRRMAGDLNLHEFTSLRGAMHPPVFAGATPDSFWLRVPMKGGTRNYVFNELKGHALHGYDGSMAHAGSTLSIHPSGTLLASAVQDLVLVYPSDGSERARRIKVPGNEAELTRFSPDGRWLAVGGGGAKGWTLFGVEEQYHWVPRFRPEGSEQINRLEFVGGFEEGKDVLAISSEDNRVGLFDPEAKEWIWNSATFRSADAILPAAQPGQFWVIQGGGESVLFDGVRRREIAKQSRWKGWIEPETQFAHSRSSELVAFANPDGELQICERENLDPIFDPSLIGQLDPEAEAHYIAFASDGSRLLLCSRDRAFALETHRWRENPFRELILAELLGDRRSALESTVEEADAVEEVVRLAERYFSDPEARESLKRSILEGAHLDWTLAAEVARRVIEMEEAGRDLDFALELAARANALAGNRSSATLALLSDLQGLMNRPEEADRFRGQARLAAATELQRERSQDLDEAGAPSPVPEEVPVESRADSDLTASGERWPPLPAGEWVDLTPFIDPLNDSGSWNHWAREIDGWQATDHWPHLYLPVQVFGGFELDMTIRRDREPLEPSSFELYIPVGESWVAVGTDAISRGGIGIIGGPRLGSDGVFEPINDALPHHFNVRVELSGDEVSIEARMDETRFASWSGAQSEVPVVSRLPVSRLGGIVWRVRQQAAGFTLMKARIRLLDGSGHLVPPGVPPRGPFHGRPMPIPPDVAEAVDLAKIEGDQLPAGQWIDLMPALGAKAEEDNWEQREDGWSPPGGGWKSLRFPVNVDGSFELVMMVSREIEPMKNGGFEIRSEVGNGFRIGWGAGGLGNASGLSQIHGEGPHENGTFTKHLAYNDGEVHAFRLRYEASGGQVRVVSTVDEHPHLDWSGPAYALELAERLRVRKGHLQVVFTDATRFTLHRCFFKLLEGTATKDLPESNGN